MTGYGRLGPAAAAALPRAITLSPRAPAPAGATGTGAPEALRADSGAPRAGELFRLLDEKILAGLLEHQVPGAAVAVLYRGHEHVRGFGVTDVRHPAPVDGDTLFRIGSTTKTFTGTAAMRLAEAGRLSLDAEVGHCLPGFQPPPGTGRITVRQLLNHTAGWLGDSFCDTGRGAGALPRYVARLRGLPQLTPAGSLFSYNNAAVAVAGRVVECAAGRAYEYAVRGLLLRPLRLRHTFFFSDEIIGYQVAAPHATVGGRATVQPRLWHLPRSIHAAGGLISSAADLLRWARFHLGDGRAPDGTRLLARASLEGMRSRPGPGGTLQVELTGAGVSWMLRPTAQGVPVVQHGGHWPGQISGFLLVPGQQFALILLTNSESAGPLIHELFAGDWALRLFTGLQNLPARRRSLSPAQLAPFLGRYTLQQVDVTGRLVDLPPATVTAADGGLRLSTGEGPCLRLVFYGGEGDDRVLVMDAGGRPRGTRADFVRDAAGRVRWLRLGGRLHRRQL